MPPFEVMTAGIMAMIRTPSEEFVALWEARDHIGAELCNIPGTLIWNELMTRDVAKSTAFYTQALGWDAAEHDGYTFLTNNGTRCRRHDGNARHARRCAASLGCLLCG